MLPVRKARIGHRAGAMYPHRVIFLPDGTLMPCRVDYNSWSPYAPIRRAKGGYEPLYLCCPGCGTVFRMHLLPNHDSVWRLGGTVALGLAYLFLGASTLGEEVLRWLMEQPVALFFIGATLFFSAWIAVIIGTIIGIVRLGKRLLGTPVIVLYASDQSRERIGTEHHLVNLSRRR